MNLVEELISKADLIKVDFETKDWEYAKLMRRAAREITELKRELLGKEYTIALGKEHLKECAYRLDKVVVKMLEYERLKEEYFNAMFRNKDSV